MPRLRKYILSLSDQESFKEVRSELQSKAELDDFDIQTAVITLKQRKQSYTAQPEKSIMPEIYGMDIKPRLG